MDRLITTDVGAAVAFACAWLLVGILLGYYTFGRKDKNNG